MSWPVLSWALRQDIENSTGKMILVALADFADAEGVSYPSHFTLAKTACCSTRTVYEWLIRFEDRGMLRRVERRREDGYRSSDEITLLFKAKPEEDRAETSLANPAGEISLADAAGEISLAGFSHENSDDLTRSNCEARTSQRTTRSSKPRARENPKAKSREAAKPTDAEAARQALETVLDPERAAQVVEHRKRLRAPLTASAAKALAKKFAEHPDPGEAVDEMLANGWRGFQTGWVEQRKARSQRASARSPPMRSVQERMVDLCDRIANGEPLDDPPDERMIDAVAVRR